MNWWQVLLFPFAIIYDLVTRFRNHLYNIGYKKSFEFEVNVVSVGNLSVGGTGKTPMVMYLIEYFLGKGKTIATLSRGYGRKTKGFLICSEADSARTVGDEPYTYFENFGDKVMVSVCEDRALGIPFILAENPEIDLILLDDAFQHRSVKPNFSVLLTPFQLPFWRDYVLPSGRLRESRNGAKRGDAIIVTRSEEESSFEELDLLDIPYFQTHVSYEDPVFFSGNGSIDKVILVAGLANNKPFFDHANRTFQVIDTFSFKDHHNFTSKDIRRIREELDDSTTLLTTHKDAVKLKAFSELSDYMCAYIPIKVKFFGNEERFLQIMEKNLKDYPSNQ